MQADCLKHTDPNDPGVGSCMSGLHAAYVWARLFCVLGCRVTRSWRRAGVQASRRWVRRPWRNRLLCKPAPICVVRFAADVGSACSNGVAVSRQAGPVPLTASVCVESVENNAPQPRGSTCARKQLLRVAASVKLLFASGTRSGHDNLTFARLG